MKTQMIKENEIDLALMFRNRRFGYEKMLNTKNTNGENFKLKGIRKAVK